MSLVLYSVDDHVALITVNDPDRRNAVTSDMSTQLRAAIEIQVHVQTEPRRC